jgi:cytochrome c-type biogenesis protein CcmH/NrfF
MTGDVPGKLLFTIGLVMAGVLMFYTTPSDLLNYALWGLAVVLLILGLINWGVK